MLENLNTNSFASYCHNPFDNKKYLESFSLLEGTNKAKIIGLTTLVTLLSCVTLGMGGLLFFRWYVNKEFSHMVDEHKMAELFWQKVNASAGDKSNSASPKPALSPAAGISPENTPNELKASLAGAEKLPAKEKPAKTAPARDTSIVSYKKGEVKTKDVIPKGALLGRGLSGTVYQHGDKPGFVVKKFNGGGMGFEGGFAVDLQNSRSPGLEEKHPCRREHALGVQLDHPNIVKFGRLFVKKYGDAFKEDKYSLEMEEIKGKTIQNFNMPNVAVLYHLLKQAEDCCQYLHQKGVVWGDVNEGNIFVTEDHNLMICDLGMWTTQEEMHRSNLKFFEQDVQNGSLTASVAKQKALQDPKMAATLAMLDETVKVVGHLVSSIAEELTSALPQYRGRSLESLTNEEFEEWKRASREIKNTMRYPESFFQGKVTARQLFLATSDFQAQNDDSEEDKIGTARLRELFRNKLENSMDTFFTEYFEGVREALQKAYLNRLEA